MSAFHPCAGNALVIKPSELTPVTATALAEIAFEGGLWCFASIHTMHLNQPLCSGSTPRCLEHCAWARRHCGRTACCSCRRESRCVFDACSCYSCWSSRHPEQFLSLEVLPLVAWSLLQQHHRSRRSRWSWEASVFPACMHAASTIVLPQP